MRNKIPDGNCIKSFCGVIKGSVVYVVDDCHELVACDGGYNKVGVPRLSFGKVGGTCLFAGGSGGWGIDGILGRSCRRDVKH